MADEMAVKLVLPKYVAERLRAMCHLRGMTASQLVAEWTFRANEKGQHLSEQDRRVEDFHEMVGDILKGKKV